MPNPWMQEHLSDYYVKQAKREGYPSRAAYKLLELQEKDKINYIRDENSGFRRGSRRLDCGGGGVIER